MNEPGWLTFYTAAREVEQRLGGSQADAQARLRRACADEKIRSMKAPYDDGLQLPIKLWKRVAFSEWRTREVDYDGPDADGCAIEVMLRDNDFRHWLDQQPQGTVLRAAPTSRKVHSPKRDFVQQAINHLWSGRVPPLIPNNQIEKQVTDWIADHCKQEKLRKPDISGDTILRAAGRKQ